MVTIRFFVTDNDDGFLFSDRPPRGSSVCLPTAGSRVIHGRKEYSVQLVTFSYGQGPNKKETHVEVDLEFVKECPHSE